MTDRERITEILKAYTKKHNISASSVILEEYAEELVANGVIVPPCKVGDIYYTIEKYCNTDPYATEKEKVSASDCEYWCNGEHCSFKEYRIEEHKWASVITILEKQQWFGEHYFLTKDEAEEKLRERNTEND